METLPKNNELETTGEDSYLLVVEYILVPQPLVVEEMLKKMLKL